ncbi:gluconate 2-dehydrogenase subunit 3 family protein [Terriglobus roseus]|nr:gluconate 2-dehydrogenase subunit 3 family protein [Terriglobus roseus]
MQRRDVLRLLASTAVISALPVELMQSLQQARAQSGPGGSLRTLNAHQNLTITTMSDIIIPETTTPGAKGAKVNEFIDLLLTEWYDKPDTDHFLQGIAEADATSRKRFGKAFVDCTTAQQVQLMKTWDDEAMQYARALKAKPTGQMLPPPANFFYTVKRLTLVGYYTSEVGFSKELGKTIIPMKHAGCAPLSEARS